MPDLPFHERQHLEKLLQQQSSIKYLFDAFVRRIGVIMTGWQDTGNDNVWIRNKSIENKIEKELQQLHNDIYSNIDKYTADAWKRSNVKTDDLVNSYIEGLSLNNIAKNGMFFRNQQVLQTFLKQKIDGLNLSDRIWKTIGTAKDNIEYYLSSGLATGRPAHLISQDIRQLLKEPDRRFHRIRNKDGKLVPSAPMKDYHPGQGVYRSSYKNALRLAVTNTNEMYRLTDSDRWQSLNFVIGIEIKRSSSTTYGACSICDPLAGRYPKDYKFKGWHPWCICIATPILMKQEDFIESLITGNWTEPITDIPKNSRSYFDDLLSKNKISTKSYLFRENSKFFDKTINTANGSVSVLYGVDTKASDYSNVLASATYFANQGSKVEILPRVHYNDQRYKELYSGLIGTRYEGKSPDFAVDGKFYEHEGFVTKNPNNALSNMLRHGLKQSDRLIIEDCGHTIWYYKKRIHDYIRDNKNKPVSEIWLLKSDKLILLYKKAEAR